MGSQSTTGAHVVSPADANVLCWVEKMRKLVDELPDTTLLNISADTHACVGAIASALSAKVAEATRLRDRRLAAEMEVSLQTH